MTSYRINTNYAKALLMLATDRQDVDRVADDMRMVSQVTAENHELSVVFANPVLPADKKASIVRELFTDHVCDTTMAFLVFLVRKNRSVNMHGVSEAYLDMWRDVKGIVLSNLSTYQPVDEEARKLVTQMVQDYTGRHVELHEDTDAQMLGGFKLEFDHKMYDARLRTKIRKLRQEFAKNDYESKL